MNTSSIGQDSEATKAMIDSEMQDVTSPIIKKIISLSP
jgi:hypothetical protein